MENRRYIVWIIGKRITTETKLVAGNITLAKIKFASRMGLKSYQVDALVDKGY